MLKVQALLLTIFIALSGCSDDIEVNTLSRSSTIVAFGDSLTYGYGANTLEDSYPSKLEEITGYKVINAGLNGDTAHNGTERIISVVEESNPNLVILSLGGNDMLRKQDQKLAANLSKIIEYLKTRNIQVVILAEPQPSITLLSMGLSDADVYNELANKYDIPIIKEVFSKYLSQQKYKSDTIHLNSEGYQLVAEDVAKELKSIGLISY